MGQQKKRKNIEPPRLLDSINRQSRLAAASVFLLIYALLAAFFYLNVPVDIYQLPNWYANYTSGYNHRGVMGSLFQLLHGKPSVEKIQQIIPGWDTSLLLLLLVFAWALMLPRILVLAVPPAQKWFLLAVAAVLLMAPVWRTNAFNIGFMDKYVLLAVLIALTMLVANRPWLFAVFSCIGFLIHPMMIFYNLLFAMLIVHGCLFSPRYTQQYKTWLMVAALPLALAGVLYFLNNPQNTIDQLVRYDFPYKTQLSVLRNNYLSPERNFIGIKIYWELFPRNFWLGVLIFGGIPLLFSIVTAFYLHRCGGNLSLAKAVQAQLASRPILQRSACFIARYHLLIILPLAAVFALPIHLTAVDWSRFFYLAWWGIMVAYVYLLWLMPANNTSVTNSGKHLSFPAILLFILAYTFAGSLLNVSWISRPFTIRCQQFCIPLLTDNPLGHAYSNAVSSVLINSLLPINGSGKQAIQLLNMDTPPPLTAEGAAKIPADYSGDILHIPFTTLPETIIFTVNYEANRIPQLNLRVGETIIKPTQQTLTQTRWMVRLKKISLPHYYISTHNSAFTFQSFSVKKHAD